MANDETGDPSGSATSCVNGSSFIVTEAEVPSRSSGFLSELIPVALQCTCVCSYNNHRFSRSSDASTNQATQSRKRSRPDNEPSDGPSTSAQRVPFHRRPRTEVRSTAAGMTTGCTHACPLALPAVPAAQVVDLTQSDDDLSSSSSMGDMTQQQQQSRSGISAKTAPANPASSSPSSAVPGKLTRIDQPDSSSPIIITDGNSGEHPTPGGPPPGANHYTEEGIQPGVASPDPDRSPSRALSANSQPFELEGSTADPAETSALGRQRSLSAHLPCTLRFPALPVINSQAYLRHDVPAQQHREPIASPSMSPRIRSGSSTSTQHCCVHHANQQEPQRTSTPVPGPATRTPLCSLAPIEVGPASGQRCVCGGAVFSPSAPVAGRCECPRHCPGVSPSSRSSHSSTGHPSPSAADTRPRQISAAGMVDHGTTNTGIASHCQSCIGQHMVIPAQHSPHFPQVSPTDGGVPMMAAAVPAYQTGNGVGVLDGQQSCPHRSQALNRSVDFHQVVAGANAVVGSLSADGATMRLCSNCLQQRYNGQAYHHAGTGPTPAGIPLLPTATLQTNVGVPTAPDLAHTAPAHANTNLLMAAGATAQLPAFYGSDPRAGVALATAQLYHNSGMVPGPSRPSSGQLPMYPPCIHCPPCSLSCVAAGPGPSVFSQAARAVPGVPCANQHPNSAMNLMAHMPHMADPLQSVSLRSHVPTTLVAATTASTGFPTAATPFFNSFLVPHHGVATGQTPIIPLPGVPIEMPEIHHSVGLPPSAVPSSRSTHVLPRPQTAQRAPEQDTGSNGLAFSQRAGSGASGMSPSHQLILQRQHDQLARNREAQARWLGHRRQQHHPAVNPSSPAVSSYHHQQPGYYHRRTANSLAAAGFDEEHQLSNPNHAPVPPGLMVNPNTGSLASADHANVMAAGLGSAPTAGQPLSYADLLFAAAAAGQPARHPNPAAAAQGTTFLSGSFSHIAAPTAGSLLATTAAYPYIPYYHTGNAAAATSIALAQSHPPAPHIDLPHPIEVPMYSTFFIPTGQPAEQLLTARYTAAYAASMAAAEAADQLFWDQSRRAAVAAGVLRMGDMDAPRGATRELIQRCTTKLLYRRKTDDHDIDQCTICLTEFQDSEELRSLSCTHSYHVSCIDRWLLSNKRCPICRVEIDRAGQSTSGTQSTFAAV